MELENDFNEILILIEQSRQNTYRKVNQELILLYYKIGQIVHQKVISGKWGNKTVEQLSEYILSKIPNLSGFSRRGLYRMKQFYEIYSPESEFFKFFQTLLQNENMSPEATQIHSEIFNQLQIVSALPTQLQSPEYLHDKLMSALLTQIPWTHHVEIFSVSKKHEEILFYLLHSIEQKLSFRELRRQIKTATFERTILAKQNSHVVKVNKTASHFFKDPYIFEFLDLPENLSEKDLEAALVQNLKNFILEIGKGFTYMGNQFRIQVGNKDYYTDLLFYHRDLQCLVLFELKIEEFQPEFLGKLNFYLEALDRDIKRPNENPSIGVLLCKGKDAEVVEYAMARNVSPALVADYETKLIPKNILLEKLNYWTSFFDKNIDL